MVRVSVPMWLAQKAAGHVDWDARAGRRTGATPPAGSSGGCPSRTSSGRASGILAEVDEDGGEQVLVWLR